MKEPVEGSSIVEKQHPKVLHLPLDQRILAMRTILTQWWILWHWEKQMMVDAPKNLKQKK